MLFDMQTDPSEFHDLGRSADHQEIIDLMYRRLGKWTRRVTKFDAQINAGKANPSGVGIVLGVYDQGEIDPDLTIKYRGASPDRQA